MTGMTGVTDPESTPLRRAHAAAVEAVPEYLAMFCDEGHNFPPLASYFRGRQEIVRTVMMFPGEDYMIEVVRCINYITAGLGADILTLYLDTFIATPDYVGLNPLTGEDWKANEMQDAAENHDAIAKGWMTEAVGIFTVNRADDHLETCYPYRRTPDGVIIPGEPMAENEPDSGLILALQRIMSKPTAAAVTLRHQGHLPDEKTRDEIALAAAKMRWPRLTYRVSPYAYGGRSE